MRERSDRFWLPALALLLFAVFFDILLLGNTLYFRDIVREYYPSRHVLHDLIRSGTFPFWNPRYGCGQPFAANPGYQAFYPIGLLTLWLPDFRFAFHLDVLFHYFLAAFAMYALLRSCRLRPDSAALGAISWSLGGLLTGLSNLLPFLFAAAWLPLLILFARRCAIRFTRFDFACTSAVLGIIVLNGDQAMILQAGCIAFAVIVYCRRNIARAFAMTAGIAIVALLVGAAQVIPAIDFVRDSGRSMPLLHDEVMLWSLFPARPLEFFFPGLYGRFTAGAQFFWAFRFLGTMRHPFLFSIYPGLIVTLLFIGGVAARVRGWTLALAGLVGSYLIALGQWGPVFPVAYALGFRSLRYPEKFFIPGVLAVTIFAAIAFDAFTRSRRGAVIAAWSVVVIAVAAALFSLLPAYAAVMDAIWHLGPAPQIVAQSRISWFVAAGVAILTAVALALHGRVPVTVWSGLCVVVLIVDLAPRNPGLMPRLRREFATPPPLALAIGRPPSAARIFNRADWQYFTFGSPLVPPSVQPWILRNALLPRTYTTWGLNGALDLDITKTDLLPMVDFTGVFWDVARKKSDNVELMLAMAGVTHVIDAEPMSEWSGADVEHIQPVAVSFRPSARRYYFASQVMAFDGAGDFERKILAGQFRDPAVAFVGGLAFSVASGEVLRIDERPNDIRLDVRTAGRALLVVSVTAHKYWRAAVDGADAPILRTNLAFQGVIVPPGQHRVELHYRNPIILYCCAISALAALVLAVVLIVERRAVLARFPIASDGVD